MARAATIRAFLRQQRGLALFVIETFSNAPTWPFEYFSPINKFRPWYQRMWEPINPSEGETRSLVKLQTCRILLIVRFVYDILRYSWNFLSEKKIRRIIQKRRRRILDRSIDSEFLYSSIPRLYSLFFSLKISTKFPRKRLRQSERIDPTLATLPHRSIAQGVDQKMEFFSSSRRRNLFIERIHSSDRRTFQSWARATFLNRSGRKEKMDR